MNVPRTVTVPLEFGIVVAILLVIAILAYIFRHRILILWFFDEPLFLIVIGTTLASVLAVLIFAISSVRTSDVESAGIMAAMVSLLGMVTSSLYLMSRFSSRASRKRIEEAEKELEKQRDEGKSFRGFLREEIHRAQLREDVAMRKAEIRADRLYSIGASLTIMSVLWPLIGIAFYWAVEPLPQSTIDRVIQLHDKIGTVPSSIQLSAHRDWRMLLGGVSIGFLFLAASAGILRQKTKEVAIMENSAARVSYLERIESLLALEAKEKDDDEKILLRFAQKHFLVDPVGRGRTAADTESDGDLASLSLLLQAIKWTREGS